MTGYSLDLRGGLTCTESMLAADGVHSYGCWISELPESQYLWVENSAYAGKFVGFFHDEPRCRDMLASYGTDPDEYYYHHGPLRELRAVVERIGEKEDVVGIWLPVQGSAFGAAYYVR